MKIHERSTNFLEITFLSIFLILVYFSNAIAADICVTPSGSGSGKGTDWNNTASWESMGSTSFIRGNTYYLADGAYASKTLSTAPSGSQYITIKKAIFSDHGPETGWVSSYGDGVATFTAPIRIQSAYWTIDGQTGGGYGRWVSGHGIKIDATNHTQAVYVGGGSTAANYINLYHIEMEGVWDGDGSINVGVYARQDGEYPSTKLTGLHLSHLYIHDFGNTSFTPINVDNILLENSYLARNESTPGEHGEPIAVKHGGDNHIYRNNYFKEANGTCASVCFKKNYAFEIYNHIQFFGNIVANGHSPRGVLSDTDQLGGATNDVKVYNNVFANIAVGLGQWNGGIYFAKGGTEHYYYNNIFYNIDTTNFIFTPGATMRSNWVYNIPGDDAAWAAKTGGIVGRSDPFINSAGEDFRLSSGISGYNLDSIWPGIYKIDQAGNTCGADGVWDIGAFEYKGGGGKPPMPPTALIIK